MQSSSPQPASQQPPSSQLRGLKPRIGDFFAHDGLPVGGIAVALMLGTYALLALPPSGPLLVLACCGTVLIYQLDRLLGFSPEDDVNRPGRRRWMRTYRPYVLTTIAGALIAGGAMLMLVQPITALVGAGLGAVGLLHVWPVGPSGRRLKAWGWIKPVAISGAWAAGAVVLPVLEADRSLTSGVWALAAYRFGIVGVNTLLADWSDRVGDARVGLQTIATGTSAGFVFCVAYALLAFVLGSGLGAVVAGEAPPLLLVDLIGVLLLGGVVRRVQCDTAWAHHIAVDAVVAWPAVTFLVAWLGG
jgi:4-hydroxybenzoate polyprenyltransferase